MTVASSTSRVKYSCNGSTTSFAFTFGVGSSSEIQVIYTNASGVDTTLTETTNYTVSATNNDFESGGRVITVATYATGTYLTILRNIPLTQESDFTENQATLYETFENGLDKSIRIDQQQQEELNRIPKLAKSSTYATGNYTFPDPLASSIIGWNSGATDLTTYLVNGSSVDISNVVNIGDYSNNIATAIASIGSAETTICINASTSGNATIPSNVQLWFIKGGQLTGNITFTGGPDQITASLSQEIFSASSTIVFASTGSGYISPDWLDGTDTQKVQWAVDMAEAALSGLPIKINRMYTLTASVMIDYSDVTRWFRIIGEGQNAGFYTSSAIDMFSSNNAHTTAPVVNGVKFENIRFEASANTVNCWVVDGDKFVRIRFIGCDFQKIRCAYTENYFQSWWFEDINVYGIKGWFMQVVSAGASLADGLISDFHMQKFAFEAGSDAGSGGIKTDNTITGSSISDGSYQSMYGALLDGHTCTGVTVSNVYFEGNINPATALGGNEILFGMGSILTIKGNYFYSTSTDAGSWAVVGDLSANPVSSIPVRIVSEGNFAKNNYFDNSTFAAASYSSEIASDGDVSELGTLFKDDDEVNQDKPRNAIVSILDDHVTTFNVPTYGTIIIGSSANATVTGMLGLRTDTGSESVVDLGTRGGNLNITTGALAGTTGSDGKVTVSVAAGVGYIENRIGSTLTVTYSLNGF